MKNCNLLFYVFYCFLVYWLVIPDDYIAVIDVASNAIDFKWVPGGLLATDDSPQLCYSLEESEMFLKKY